MQSKLRSRKQLEMLNTGQAGPLTIIKCLKRFVQITVSAIFFFLPRKTRIEGGMHQRFNIIYKNYGQEEKANIFF